MSKPEVTPAGSLEDAKLSGETTQYRTLVAQRYTACTPTDLQRLLSTPPFLCSRKLDGELWFLDTLEDKPRLSSSNGRIAKGLKILDEAQSLPSGWIIAGELYSAKDSRERVGDVAKAFSSGEDNLAFAAFDLVLSNSGSWQEISYGERLELLKSKLETGGKIHPAETEELSVESEVITYFNKVVEESKGEGIVVRCSDGRILKVKPSITLDTVVLAFTTETGKDGAQQVRSLLLGLSVPEGGYLPLTATGNFESGFSTADLLKILLPLEMESRYRQAASTGQIYRFVKPEVLVESRVLDVQTLDSQGRRIRQPLLQIIDGVWQSGQKVAAASLINATVLRERNDKADVVEGSRWQQISEYADVPSKSGDSLPESKIVRREVWKKESSGKTDVRKLVVFQTNKDQVDPLYPAFVVHWTDFSATRKAPLSREVKIAQDLDTANQIADTLIAENIKKGWEPAN